MPSQLQIQLLGSPSVAQLGEICPIPRSQTRALLYRLAAAPTPLTRGQLCLLFWPGDDNNTARRKLTQALSHLRRALPNPELVETMTEQIRLHPAQVWTDVVAFETLCRQEEGRIHQLREAVDLYRGSFLDGVLLPDAPEFENWKLREHRRLEHRYLEALNTLIEHATVHREHEQAIDYARRSLAVDELDEAMHRRLILCYAASGNRRAALQQYEQCVDVLMQRRGVKPSQETRLVYESIRDTLPVFPVHSQESSEPPPPALQIELFGTFRLTYAGQLINIDSARLQSLLAYLLLHAGRPHLRQHLAFLFWPDSTEAQARTNLRNLLHQLRATLPAIEQFLDVEPNSICWQAPAPHALDVAEYEHAAQQVGEAERTGDRAAQRTWLERAVMLYPGDLLPGCYDDWILPIRDRLRTQFLRLSEQLIELLTAEHADFAAIHHAQRLLRHDPLHEETYRRLMNLHARNGARARALRIYHTCVTTLQQELNIEPMAETRAVYERLLNGSSAPASPLSAGRSTTTLPLFGRGVEWQQLLKTWHGVGQTGTHCILITGEAGIGKTRLVEELLSWVEHQGCTTAFSRSYAAEGVLAYSPIAAWLHTDHLESVLPTLDQVWRSEVARLIPELLVADPSLPPPEPMTESWQRQRFFEALVRAVLAAKQPLLLILDDLQWCDRETLEWLHYLLRCAPQIALLIVGTVRSEEAHTNPALAKLVQQLRRDQRMSEIELTRLNAQETALLAHQISGGPLDQARADELYRETEGNPLFVVETMRSVSESRELKLQSLPSKVQAVIEARLGQLSPPAQTVAELAAVVGREFRFDVLAQASAGNEDALVQGLDELWQRHIIREQGTDAYDFSHGKIREVAYARISQARRRLLHRCVAEALEHIYDANLDQISGQVAAHYEQAGLAGRAVDYYQRAAWTARQVYANQETILLTRKGLRLLETLPRNPQRDSQELELQIILGRALGTTQGWSTPEVEHVYRRARELCIKIDRPSQLFLIVHGLWQYHLIQAHLEEARELAEELVQLAQLDWNPELLSEAHRALGTSYYLLADLPAALTQLKQALSFYDPQQHHTLVYRFGHDSGQFCLSILVHVLWHLGYADQAVQKSHELLALAKAKPHPYSYAIALDYVAMLYHFRGEHQLAQQAIEKAIALCTQHGFAYYLAWGPIIQGWILVEQGQVEQGWIQIRQGLQALEETKAALRKPYYLLLLAAAKGKLGQCDTGLAFLKSAEMTMHETGERLWEAEIYRVQGELLTAQRKTEARAEHSFQLALDAARRQNAKALELRAVLSLSRLWQKQGKSAQARSLLTDIYHWFSEGFDVPDLVEAKRLLDSLGASLR
jgi:DNA-binding SARP family transcriptional activator/predicted ATPase